MVKIANAWVTLALFLWFQAYTPLAAGENVAVPETRLLVKFKPEISRAEAAAVLRRHHVAEFAPLRRATTAEPMPMDRWWIVGFPASSDLQAAAAALRAEPAVEVVEMEGTYRLFPN